MGNWSKQQRKGGSGRATAAPSLNFMVTAHKTGGPNADLTYAQPQLATAFTPGEHTTTAPNRVSISYAQISANVVRVTYVANIGLNTQTTYSGVAPNVLTPQTIAFT